MKYIDITKNNKLIADFMGIKDDNNEYFHKSSKYFLELHELKYDTSWDWIMEVVDVIENIKGLNGESIYKVIIFPEKTYILEREYDYLVLVDKIDDLKRIDIVYMAVIEFINKQNKK